MEYVFHFNNTMAETGLYLALRKLLGTSRTPPVVLCIGSDLAVGDSLGPIAGTMLRRRGTNGGYVYGTLRDPVTAREAKYLAAFLKKTHPETRIIAVDAAVGVEEEVGLIKVSAGSLRPGAGANKRLPKVGDISILGIVAKRSPLANALFNLTRLNVTYGMAEIISSSIFNILWEKDEICSQNFV